MTRLPKYILAASLSAACFPVWSDGQTLLEECGELMHFAKTGNLDEHSVGASFCMGMVNGMMAMNSIYQAKQGSTALFCPPPTVITNAEGARIVTDYLHRHPEKLDLDASSLMFFAFQEAFPCGEGIDR